jgi:hypothetical protein
MNEQREARYKIFYLPDMELRELFRGRCTEKDGQRNILTIDVPEGAIFDAVYYDFSRSAFAFRLWSADFDIVPNGALIPDCGLLAMTSRIMEEVPPEKRINFGEFLGGAP